MEWGGGGGWWRRGRERSERKIKWKRDMLGGDEHKNGGGGGGVEGSKRAWKENAHTGWGKKEMVKEGRRKIMRGIDSPPRYTCHTKSQQTKSNVIIWEESWGHAESSQRSHSVCHPPFPPTFIIQHSDQIWFGPNTCKGINTGLECSRMNHLFPVHSQINKIIIALVTHVRRSKWGIKSILKLLSEFCKERLGVDCVNKNKKK